MKELSIEEKAKLYDKAIKRAESIYNETAIPSATTKGICTYIFPELKESEDERIRKTLIKYFRNCVSLEGINGEDISNWLEKQGEQKTVDEIAKEVCKNKESAVAFFKSAGIINANGELADEYKIEQGEQKPTNEVEPKFKVGDWIIKNDDSPINIDYICCEITKVENGNYTIESIYGYKGYNTFETFEKDYHLWTIQDAKDGDVIYSRHNTESFEWIGIFKSLDKENKRVFFYGFWHDMAKTFSVCRNEAYVLYNDFSPATKEQRDLLFSKMQEAGYEWDAEKKELRKIVAPIFHIGDRVRYKGHACDGVITEITNTDYICGNAKLPISTQDKLELVEQNPTWSEEDEDYYDAIISKLEVTQDDALLTDNQMKFLKSLKDRYTWKPSKEQIVALRWVLNNVPYNKHKEEISGLLDQIKEL